MRHLTLIGVFKDIGSADVGIPLMQTARERGHKTVVIAEGLAAGMFEREGFTLFFKGSENFKTEPFPFDMTAALETLQRNEKNPVVITGTSFPVNLEREATRAAHELGLPLAVIEDFWTGSKRVIESGAVPDLILTPDDYAAICLRKELGKDVRIATVGMQAADLETLFGGNNAAENAIDRLKTRYGTTIFVATGGETNTDDELRLFVACLRRTKTDAVIIPGLHPKIAHLVSAAHSNRTYGEEWLRILETSGFPVAQCDAPSEHLAGLADVSAGGFSTLLVTAASAGRRVFAINTPATRERLEAQSYVHRFPLVDLGAAHEITEPMDLAPFFKETPRSDFLKRLPPPYSPNAALNAIEELASLPHSI